MHGNLLVRHARAVLPDRVVPDAFVRVYKGSIVAVRDRPIDPIPGEPVLEAEGRLLLPGLMNLRCDRIFADMEREPGPAEHLHRTLAEFDRRVAPSGVTTVYHAIPLSGGCSRKELAARLARTVAHFIHASALIRHHVHLVLDDCDCGTLDLAAELMDEGCVGVLSLGVQPVEEAKQPGMSANDGERRRRLKAVGRGAAGDGYPAGVRTTGLRDLCSLARSLGIPVAAHGLESGEAVEEAATLGATIGHYPSKPEAVSRAASWGMDLCVDVSELMAGRDRARRLACLEAISSGTVDVVFSSAKPLDLLKAVLRLPEMAGCPVEDAVGFASHRVAAATGMGGLIGGIENGSMADMVLLDRRRGTWVVDTVMVGGIPLPLAECPDPEPLPVGSRLDGHCPPAAHRNADPEAHLRLVVSAG